MKYVIPQGGGGDYRPYARYLESVKHLMPAHLFAFAANSENFDLRSPNSLHDAWLEEWSIVEVVLPNERRKRLIEIRDAFLVRSTTGISFSPTRTWEATRCRIQNSSKCLPSGEWHMGIYSFMN